MSDPGPTPTPLSDLDDLIAAFHTLDDARTELRSAHADTGAAAQNVTDVTVTAQAVIDQATASYDQQTTLAKADLTSKQAAEAGKKDAEDAAFDAVEAKLAAFKAAT
jgi:hypothetical protein